MAAAEGSLGMGARTAATDASEDRAGLATTSEGRYRLRAGGEFRAFSLGPSW